MKNKYRNIFLAFGIVAVLIMIFTFDMDYQELWANLKRAGVYLPLVLLLWLFVYLINTTSWYIIIRSGGKPGFSFARLYKFTVTGFALNYVTPVGLMGGEPYHHDGTETVYRSEISHFFGDSLRDDAHLFSFLLLAEFCLAIPLPLSGRVGDGTIWVRSPVFCLLVAMLFVKGYQHGMAVAFVRLGSHLPFLKKESNPFCRLPSGTVGEHR